MIAAHIWLRCALSFGLALAMTARAPAFDGPPVDVALEYDVLGCLLVACDARPAALSPLSGVIAPSSELDVPPARAVLQQAGLLAADGKPSPLGRRCCDALASPELALQLRQTRRQSWAALWFLIRHDEAWAWTPLQDMCCRIRGPFARDELAAVAALDVELPTPQASPDIGGVFPLDETATLQCVAREQAMFAGLLGGGNGGTSGLTVDEIANYLLSPALLEALVSDTSFDLARHWPELSEPTRVRGTVERLVDCGWLNSTRTPYGVRYGLSDRGALLSGTVLNAPQILEIGCYRASGDGLRASTVSLCVSAEGIVKVRTTPGTYTSVVAPLPPGDPRPAFTEAIRELLDGVSPADDTGARSAAGVGAATTRLPGDTILAELTRGVYRTASAKSTLEVWQRGRPDVWRVDSDEDGGIDVEYEDTDGDLVPDFVRMRDWPDRGFSRSFVCKEGEWEQSNLLEAFLEIRFQLPWARDAYHEHNVNVILNGEVVAVLTDVLPEGLYRFRVRPQHLRLAADHASTNDVRLVTSHLRGGHYVVSTDFKLVLHMSHISQHVIADNAEQARDVLIKQGNLVTQGVDLAVYDNEWRVEPAAPKDGQDVVIRGVVHNDGEELASGWVLRCRRGAPGAGGEEIAAQPIDALGKGERIDVSCPWKARPGEHRLFVVAEAPQGVRDLREDNNIVAIVVRGGGDSQPPALLIHEPAEASTVRGPAVPFRGTAQDNVGLSTLEYSVDGGLWQDVAVHERWEFTLELAAGEHSIRVRLCDSSGLEQSATRKILVE